MAINAFSGSLPNVDTLVSQYMALERRPIDTLKQSKSDLSVRQAMFNDLNTAMMALKTKAELLTKTGTESPFGGFSTTSSNNEAVSSTATSSAAAATYMLSVSRLASIDTIVSKQYDSKGTEIAAGFGGQEQRIDVTIGDVTKTIVFTPEAGKTNDELLSAFATAVNASGIGANASVVSEIGGKSRLTVTSKTSGSLGAVSFSTSLTGQADTGFTGVTRLLKSPAVSFAGPPAIAELTDSGSYRLEFSNRNETNGTIQVTLIDNATNLTKPVRVNGANGYAHTISIPKAGEKTSLDLSVGVSVELDSSLVNGKYNFTYQKGTSFLSNGAGALDILPDGVSSGTSGGYLKARTELDAQFKLNGLTFTRGSNTVTDAITGVTLNLKQTITSDVTVGVKSDTDSAKTKVKELLTQMNSVLKWLQTKTAVDSTTYVRGPLAGNATYTGLRNTLRYLVQDRVTSITTGDNSLSQIGIGFNEAGDIVIKDEIKFTEKLTANPQAIQAIFSNTDGVAKRIFDEANKFVKDKGILPQAKDGVANQMSSIDKRVKALEETMKRREEQIRKQLERQMQMMVTLTAQQNTLSAFMSSYSNQQY